MKARFAHFLAELRRRGVFKATHAGAGYDSGESLMIRRSFAVALGAVFVVVAAAAIVIDQRWTVAIPALYVGTTVVILGVTGKLPKWFGG